MEEYIKQQMQQPKDSYMIEDLVEHAKKWIIEQEEKPKVVFADTIVSLMSL